MGLDFWRFIHPKRLIVVEIALNDAAFFDGDLRAESIREPINDCAVNLLIKDIWIHHLTTINSVNHTMEARLAALHRNLDDGGRV